MLQASRLELDWNLDLAGWMLACRDAGLQLGAWKLGLLLGCKLEGSTLEAGRLW